MKKYYQNSIEKDLNTKADKNFNNNVKKDTTEYMYYSKVLKEPFSSISELREAEEAHYAKIKAKEDKAAQKKTDAAKVEEAFKSLNAARKRYKEELVAITAKYTEDLKKLKADFEDAKAVSQNILAAAEDTYAMALKTFTEKYPEGYHLTLKDGDFETTISSQHNSVKSSKAANTVYTMSDLFNWLFDN